MKSTTSSEGKQWRKYSSIRSTHSIYDHQKKTKKENKKNINRNRNWRKCRTAWAECRSKVKTKPTMNFWAELKLIRTKFFRRKHEKRNGKSHAGHVFFGCRCCLSIQLWQTNNGSAKEKDIRSRNECLKKKRRRKDKKHLNYCDGRI